MTDLGAPEERVPRRSLAFLAGGLSTVASPARAAAQSMSTSGALDSLFDMIGLIVVAGAAVLGGATHLALRWFDQYRRPLRDRTLAIAGGWILPWVTNVLAGIVILFIVFDRPRPSIPVAIALWVFFVIGGQAVYTVAACKRSL